MKSNPSENWEIVSCFQMNTKNFPHLLNKYAILGWHNPITGCVIPELKSAHQQTHI